MSGFEYWLAGHDSMTGTFMLLLWAAGVVTALVIVICVLAFREFAMRDTIAVLLRTAGVLVGAALVWTWLDFSMWREVGAERRALDARSTELTARAIAPGSALACLNAVDNEVVETACEHALFASPQAVAAAVVYVDAKLTLLADGLDYASHSRNYTTELDRPRRVLEADRFGIVAHVLASRGCNAEECAAFKLMQDTSRVRVNLKERLFEARVAQYASNWPAGSVPTASTTNPAAVPTPVSSAPSASALGAAAALRNSFPSSASIPPVSIMSPEPNDKAQPGKASGASATSPASESQTQPSRRQSVNRASSGQGGPPLRLPAPPNVPPQGSPQSPR
jgi:hypothetical protein